MRDDADYIFITLPVGVDDLCNRQYWSWLQADLLIKVSHAAHAHNASQLLQIHCKMIRYVFRCVGYEKIQIYNGTSVWFNPIMEQCTVCKPITYLSPDISLNIRESEVFCWLVFVHNMGKNGRRVSDQNSMS